MHCYAKELLEEIKHDSGDVDVTFRPKIVAILADIDVLAYATTVLALWRSGFTVSHLLKHGPRAHPSLQAVPHLYEELVSSLDSPHQGYRVQTYHRYSWKGWNE